MNGNEKIQLPVFISDQNAVNTDDNTDENSECETNVKQPKTFIKHCLMKINEAKHYNKTGIVMVADGK